MADGLVPSVCMYVCLHACVCGVCVCGCSFHFGSHFFFVTEHVFSVVTFASF